MGMIQTQRKCKTCGKKTLHARRSFGLGWGLLLTVLTVGVFIPIWIMIKLYEAVGVNWICQTCGQSRIT